MRMADKADWVLKGVRRGKAFLRRQSLPRNPGRPGSPKSPPVVIAGMYQTANGIGEIARRFYQTLSEAGHTPIAVDTSRLLDQVDLDTSIPLKAMPECGAGTLILIANPPEVVALLTQLNMRRWKSWRIIGYWSWELTEIPESWHRISQYCTEIWTLSDFCQTALRANLLKPVLTMPIPVSPPALQVQSSNSSVLRFLIMADGRSSFERKNVLAGVRLFIGAFGLETDVALTIKTRNIDDFPEFADRLSKLIRDKPNIDLLNQSLDDDARWALLSSHDVVLSTHRSEGFGLHLAEAMALGKCAIATGWSGNLQFMTEKNSVLLPFRLNPVRDDYNIYDPLGDAVWADVDEAAGIVAMRRVREDSSLRAQLGHQAKKDIRDVLSGIELLNEFAALSITPEAAIAP